MVSQDEIMAGVRALSVKQDPYAALRSCMLHGAAKKEKNKNLTNRGSTI